GVPGRDQRPRVEALAVADLELGLTAALVAYGGEEAAVLAGVLLYRALTYALPIPLGLLAYLRWQRGSAARKLRVAGEQPVLAGTGEGQAGR
ncbi:MAG TPA: hypothetical protein VFS18_05385, partial [Actinomycetota bacterium]|nr:hypothetical protein [Actinomycetota bacterium]